jgi:hypothetical protein
MKIGTGNRHSAVVGLFTRAISGNIINCEINLTQWWTLMKSERGQICERKNEIEDSKTKSLTESLFGLENVWSLGESSQGEGKKLDTLCRHHFHLRLLRWSFAVISWDEWAWIVDFSSDVMRQMFWNELWSEMRVGIAQ